jgi:Spy/CpxP family protein refolding chaperone
MKKVILSMMIAAFATLSVQAQEIPDRKHEEFKPVHKERMFNKKELTSLNLTDEQKTKMKSMNQDIRKQMEDLRKQDNITVKESRERMEALRKDHQAQFQSILTPEQKTQIQKDKEARKAKVKEFSNKRQERMKEELNLTDEQSAKMTENRKAAAEKIKAVRENGSLKDEEKKEQIKELMKEQKESIKSLLTEDQLKKMKENKKHHTEKKEAI